MTLRNWLQLFVIVAAFVASQAMAEPLAREDIAPLIVAPMKLGEPINDKGVYQLLNSCLLYTSPSPRDS